MNVVKINIKDILESEFNPRIALEKDSKEYKRIAKSIEEFGFVEPLVVNKHNMRCIGGCQRLRVLKDMGVGEAECVIIYEPKEAKEKALCLALNKIHGDWDTEKLAELLSDEKISEFTTGFDEEELLKYLPKENENIIINKEDETAALSDIIGEIEEAETSTVIKIGGFSFKVKASEYYNLIDGIRGKGIFDTAEIKEELRRRLLND